MLFLSSQIPLLSDSQNQKKKKKKKKKSTIVSNRYACISYKQLGLIYN